MRMFVLCLVIILTATIFSLANSENVSQLGFQSTYTNTNHSPRSIDKIFYQDATNNVILIDFKAIQEQLINVQIKQNNKVILNDQVSDLSKNIIYEVDLIKYNKGDYTIILTTSLQKTITKQFSIN